MFSMKYCNENLNRVCVSDGPGHEEDAVVHDGALSVQGLGRNWEAVVAEPLLEVVQEVHGSGLLTWDDAKHCDVAPTVLKRKEWQILVKQ